MPPTLRSFQLLNPADEQGGCIDSGRSNDTTSAAGLAQGADMVHVQGGCIDSGRSINTTSAAGLAQGADMVHVQAAPPAPQPTPSTQTRASAGVGTVILHKQPPFLAPVYRRTIAQGGELTVRVNACERLNLHFMCAIGLNIVQQSWRENERGDAGRVLHEYALGYVQEITVAASEKLRAGEYPLRIFVAEPTNTAEEEAPHSIVLFTVRHALEGCVAN